MFENSASRLSYEGAPCVWIMNRDPFVDRVLDLDSFRGTTVARFLLFSGFTLAKFACLLFE